MADEQQKSGLWWRLKNAMAGKPTEKATPDSGASFDWPAPEYFPGEMDKTGNIQWYNDEPNPAFIIPQSPPQDPKERERYEAYLRCRNVAVKMGEIYGEKLAKLNPKDPAQRLEITAIERKIVEAVNGEIHKKENFGDYNTDNQKNPASQHDDVERSKSNNPARLTEYNSGELICRQQAPLSNHLYALAWMKTVRVCGVANQLFKEENGKLLPDKATNMHDTVISLLTGNIIESTRPDIGAAYVVNMNQVTLDAFKAGTPIVMHSGGAYVAIAAPSKESRAGMLGNAKAFCKKVGDELLPVANGIYTSALLPAAQQFTKAVSEGDIEAIKSQVDNPAVAMEMREDALVNAVRTHNVPMATLMIDHGGLGRINADLPGEHSASAKAMALRWTMNYHPENPSDKRAHPNPEFQQAIMQKMGISNEEYLKAAQGYDNGKDKQPGKPEHVKLAEEMIQGKAAEKDKAPAAAPAAVDAPVAPAQPVNDKAPVDPIRQKALDAVKDIPSEMRSQIKNDSGPSNAALVASSERPGVSPVVPSAEPSTGAALA